MNIRRRIAIAALAGTACLASLLFARPGVVVTHSGARYEGDVTERGDDLIVSIKGVHTTIPRGDVATLDYTGTFDDECAPRLAELHADDVEGRLALAKWAMSQRQYVAARDAIEAALVIDPNSQDAVELQTVVRSQRRLEAQSRAEPRAAVEGSRDGSSESAEPANAAPLRGTTLSTDDIQSIRRIEWRTDDPPVRVRVDSKAARSYVDIIQQRYEVFATLNQVEQARQILSNPHSTADQRRGVVILSDPPALAEFRRMVQPVLLSGCATSGCHGSAMASFRLISPATTDDATYTNFYILNSYTRHLDRQVPAGGIFGGATELRMIDRGNSAKSLLVQYSLPAEVAEFDHPKIPNYQPLFQSTTDTRARALTGWIDRSLKISPGEYSIEWRPSRPTTLPADDAGE